MRKFFFALAMITFTYLSCVQASELGNWKIGTFVDEFGDKTSDTYITIKTKGFFSNTATENSPLNVTMMIEKEWLEDPYFKFYEYAGNNPNGSSFSISN
tara:strand:+ start:120 stop:416 length:297 start_codon:yes stop_codon:yes gene_type:complete